MNVKKFYGKNSREALAKVKLALGEDAIILANRTVNGKTEIMAVSEHEMVKATHVEGDAELQQPATALEDKQDAIPKETSFLEFVTQKQNVKASDELIATSQHVSEPLTLEDVETLDDPKVSSEDEPALIETQSTETSKESSSAKNSVQNEAQIYDIVSQTLEQKMQLMMGEMRDMRLHFESQMNAMTWQHHLQHNPAKSKVLSTLLAASFSASLARQIAEKLPNHIDTTKAPLWAKEIITRNLHTVEDENIMLDKGGVYALVGPTGVGKTTTTAKLAARYVMKHGTQNLGLITTDSYRIGGHEQLRIYGKILGVMVHAVKDEEDLKIALKELSKKHMVLIDTVGVSQRDHAVSEQLALLNKCETPIHKLLCLNATSTGETLTDVVRAYKPFEMAGCIVTKLDEAAAIGNVVDVLIRERMRLFYTTHGQRVPEDIEIANKHSLIERVLTFNNASWPYQYLEEELPLVVSNIHLDHVNKTESQHV